MAAVTRRSLFGLLAGAPVAALAVPALAGRQVPVMGFSTLADAASELGLAYEEMLSERALEVREFWESQPDSAFVRARLSSLNGAALPPVPPETAHPALRSPDEASSACGAPLLSSSREPQFLAREPEPRTLPSHSPAGCAVGEDGDSEGAFNALSDDPQALRGRP